MTLNVSGPISLAGPTTGQSIAIETANTSGPISLLDSGVEHLAGTTTNVTIPGNFYGKYYYQLSPSTSSIQYSYTTVNAQGGVDNGGYSPPTPTWWNNLAAGFRTGDILYPNSGNFWTQVDPAGYTQLAALYNDLNTGGAGAAAFSNVTWGSNTGATQWFTATLNSGYHFYSQQDTTTGTWTNGTAKFFGNPGTTITFYANATNTGFGTGGTPPTIAAAGSSRISVFQNEGMVWINNTGYTGQVYIVANIGAASAKLMNWRVNVDGVVYNQTSNGEGTTSFNGNLGPYNVNPNSSVAFEAYYWGQGNFTNASYVGAGGTFKIGYNVAIH
jgi:hypothetical protein